MTIDGLTKAELVHVASSCEVWPEFWNRAEEAFTLKPVGERYRYAVRQEKSHREVYVVCRHGHQRFFAELFAAHPAAVVRTAMRTYEGAADWEESVAESTAMYRERYGADRCSCPERDE